MDAINPRPKDNALCLSLLEDFYKIGSIGTMLLLEQMVSAFSYVARNYEEKMLSFYESLMPCFKYIIQELRLLRGKAIECVSLIGFVVGAEKFTSDVWK